MNQMYAYIPETPTSTFPDWVGVPGSPDASAQAFPTSEDASESIASFEREIDNAFDLEFNGFEQPCFPSQSGMGLDWQSEFNHTFPFAFTLDSLLDGVSSSPCTLNAPLSPVSEATLVNSPTAAVLPELKLPSAEGALVDHHIASSPPLIVDAGFTFPYQPWSATPPSGIHTTMDQSNHGHQNGDRYWPGQPLSQYEVGTACVVAAGVDTSTDSFALTSMDHTSLLPSPSAELHLVIGAEHKSIPAARTRRRRNVANENSFSNKDDAPRKRKRAKQTTTTQFPCTVPGCPRIFNRSHNQKEHISSVHRKERKHHCMALGCDRAFSRNFDLKRHFQSKHTDLGSPRKKLQGCMAAKDQKTELQELVVQGV